MIWFAVAALLAAVLFAVFDVFWPLTVALVIGLAVGWWLGHADVLWSLLRWEFAVAYVAIGFAWVFFKWTRLVEARFREQDQRPPKWADHWDDFAAYFFYWPFDVAAYVMSDLVRELWKFTARMVSRSFDRYAEWRFRSARASPR